VSDPKLRELERRWKESGALEDEVACLVERARASEDVSRRLRWAAACGYEAARRVTEAPGPDLAQLPAELVGQAEAEARFWLGVVRAGWGVLGDDRFERSLWNHERVLAGLEPAELIELAYATLASDRLMAVDDHAFRAMARVTGRSEGPPLPAHLHLEPADALQALTQHVPADVIWSVLRRDWVPWLLGYRDPVALRVATQPELPAGRPRHEDHEPPPTF
jgi:hypothetical protein